MQELPLLGLDPRQILVGGFLSHLDIPLVEERIQIADLVPAAVLVPRYGLNGAAAAWIVGNIAAALTSVWATHRRALAPRPDPMASAPQPVGAR